MNNSARLHIIIYIVLAAVIAACSSQRQAASSGDGIAQQQRPGKRSTLIADLATTYAPWHDVYMPVTLNLKRPISMGISGRATMVRDSLIHISMRMLGIEVAVAHVTADSVWLVDKYHKYVCAAATSAITGPNNLSLSDLQDMLLGRAFYPGRGTLGSTFDGASLFKVETVNDTIVATPRRLPSTHSWHFELESLPRLAAIVVNVSDQGSFRLDYSSPRTDTPAGTVAANVLGSGSFGKLDLLMAVEWNMSKAKWNSNRTENWSAPSSGYKRISAAQLISALRAQ